MLAPVHQRIGDKQIPAGNFNRIVDLVNGEAPQFDPNEFEEEKTPDGTSVRLVNSGVVAACIPDARLRVVDCGHLCLLTRAGILGPEIEDFLATT